MMMSSSSPVASAIETLSSSAAGMSSVTPSESDPPSAVHTAPFSLQAFGGSEMETSSSGSVGLTVMRQWLLNVRSRPLCRRFLLSMRIAVVIVPFVTSKASSRISLYGTQTRSLSLRSKR